MLPSGEISQDREVILSAQLAVDGIFRYLDLFREAGGEPPIVEYLNHRYEIPKNRLAIASEYAVEAETVPRTD